MDLGRDGASFSELIAFRALRYAGDVGEKNERI
jgi:hypothetical protein